MNVFVVVNMDPKKEQLIEDIFRDPVEAWSYAERCARECHDRFELSTGEDIVKMMDHRDVLRSRNNMVQIHCIEMSTD